MELAIRFNSMVNHLINEANLDKGVAVDIAQALLTAEIQANALEKIAEQLYNISLRV